MDKIPLRWLGKLPVRRAGLAWGVPFARGTARLEDAWHVVNAAGKALPTQHWPTARWPDGSLKWLACAAVVGPGDGAELALAPGAGPAPEQAVTVEDVGIEIFKRVRTGAMTVDVGDRGTAIIQEIVRHCIKVRESTSTGAMGITHGGLDRTVAGAVQLVCLLERSNLEPHGVEVRRREAGLGVIKSLRVEQAGPVRAVLRLDGVHRVQASRREVLPFTVRLVFWAGLDTIELVHSIVVDTGPAAESIAGLGVRCMTPLLEGVDNRHVRFAGAADGGEDTPIWCEPARIAHMNAPPEREQAQVSARRVEPRGEDVMLPAWDSFRLEQDSADHYMVRKRQAGPVCWVDAGHGHRAAGLAALSDPGGGMAMGVEDFWESFPAALAADGVTGTESTLTAWLWSDAAPPMDLRHYGTRDHRPVYEAVNPDPAVYSSAYGIARTSRLRLWALPAGTDHAALAAAAAVIREPPVLTCPPDRIAATQVFGTLPLTDKSTPARAAVEHDLDTMLAYFHGQVEARRWYGFWDYGDIMHSYDHVRHVWRYDIGGCAWHNAELATDLWLWYAAVRSGRRDRFRFATAMTRHVAEVDSFHIGFWKGQGSRHNVVHWGCPCKEPRVCVAQPKRWLYYLTADERMGDLLDEVAESHLGRATNVPTDPNVWHARIGPTWATFASNWMTAWERTGDPKWRHLITTGIKGILASPHGMLTGTPFEFDPATGAMRYLPGQAYAANHLVSIFGGAEAWMELTELLDDPAFTDAVAEYGRVHARTPDDFARLPESLRRTIYTRWLPAKLIAFAAVKDRNPAMARRAWQLLLEGDELVPPGQQPTDRVTKRKVPDLLRGGTVEEMHLIANHDSQWALNAMFALALVPEALDAWWNEQGGSLLPPARRGES